MAHIRTFIAVAATQRVNNNISRVVQRLAAIQSDYNWVVPENLHITLNFVGDVVDVEVPEFCKLIKGAVENVAPFEMSLHSVGAFPSHEQPRTIWIGVDEGSEQLKSLNKNIEGVLSHWGVNKDRNEYVPHMTIGRIARGGRWNEALLETLHRLRNHDGGTCQVESVIVFSSFLDRSGPTHTPMATIRLRG
jgi:2'-5' RNA ligase